MLVLSALTVALSWSCRMDEVHLPGESASQPQRFSADSVQLLSTCGDHFLVRNANDLPAELTWDVEGRSLSGRLTLPARPRGHPYSEVVLNTGATGTTRLYYQNHLIESNASTGPTCVARNEVPPFAPDFFPALILSMTPVIHDPVAPGLRYHRGIVSVAFVDGTSLVERQLIIAGIGAIVIGGLGSPSGEGEYILKLVADTSLDATQAATTALRSNPKVKYAGPSYVSSPMYRRPKEGSGWTAWKITPAGGADPTQNWALVDIAAPLAWGCETGSSTTPIAIIDETFFSLTDLRPNLDTTRSEGIGAFPSHADSSAHGTRVMSVLAAKGNNSSGMVGATWNASVRVYDLRAPDGVPNASLQPGDLMVMNRIDRAVREGAQIVSLSLGELWPRLITGYEPSPSGPRVDSAVALTRNRMRRVLTQLQSSGYDPLVVVAAGNRDGLDASLSRLPAIASDPALSSRVIVVGGSTRQRTRWRDDAIFGSSIGTLVDVVAPADAVWSMQGDGAITPASGTSFAAPLVAAVAGLLKSFDPSLTAASIKNHIVAGAVGFVAQPTGPAKPVLNAYGALRKAAERSGAPICGSQRVWGNHGTGKIIVERVRGSPATDDTLGSVDPGQMNVTFAKHGGKAIQFSLSPSTGLLWTAGGWITGTTPPNDGGIIAQYLGGSHDGDSTVAFLAPGGVTEIGIWKPGDIYETLRSPYVGQTLPSCTGVCKSGGNAFISPVKPQIWVSGGIWGQFGPTAQSYIEVFDMVAKDTAAVFKTYTGKLIFNVNQSEDGTELRVRMWVPPGNTCEYEFISLVPPDSGQVRRSITGTAPPPLGGVYCNDDGTFSPRIAPNGFHRPDSRPRGTAKRGLRTFIR